MVKALLVIIGIMAAGLLALSVIPYPNAYNVTVAVGASEYSLVIANYFTVSVNSAQVTGQSPILDWSAWGLGVAPPALQATFVMTVCIEGHCASKSRSEWFPTVPVINGNSVTASDTFVVGYVPSSSTPVTVSVTLTQNGGTVASGSGSLPCVGC